MLLQHVLLALGWILYCMLHSLLAAVFFRKKIEALLKRHYRYYRFGYVVFSFLTLIALVWYQVILPSPALFNSGILVGVIGWVISFAGLLIMGICIKKYFISLSGLRSLLNETDEGELMISGIHRYVRHPLYLGTFAFIWGLFLVLPTISFFLSNLIITIYTLIGMQLEEKKLINAFGNSYQQYKERVPALFPKLRR